MSCTQSNTIVNGKKRQKHSFSGSLEDVVGAQLRKFDGVWKTLGIGAPYRTRNGVYSELPERTTT